MNIVELTNKQFNEYVIKNNYNSIYQTPEYTNTMRNQGYTTLLLGLVNNNEILGATSILINVKKGKIRPAKEVL